MSAPFINNSLSQALLFRSPGPRLAKIGAVNYLNSKPLIEGLNQLLAGRASLGLDYPSCLADDLASGDLDIALIPSIEYFRGG